MNCAECAPALLHSVEERSNEDIAATDECNSSSSLLLTFIPSDFTCATRDRVRVHVTREGGPATATTARDPTWPEEARYLTASLDYSVISRDRRLVGGGSGGDMELS